MANGISADVDFNEKGEAILGMPKRFSICYVCKKKYGSKSIAFHEPQCLQKWRNENNKLPVNQRSSTPMRSWTADGSSDKQILQETDKRWIQREKTVIINPRPQTATLTQPKVLDPNFAHHVDMTKHCRRTNRSQTFYLINPTPNLTIPHISLSSKKKPVHPTNKSDITNRLLKNGMKPHASTNFIESSKNTPGLLESLPEPCQSCAKGNHSERLHSHPAVPFRNKNKRNTSQLADNLNQNGAEKKHGNVINYRRRVDLGHQKQNNYLSAVDEVSENQIADENHSNKETRFHSIKCKVCGRAFSNDDSSSIHQQKCFKVRSKRKELTKSAEINEQEQRWPQNERTLSGVGCLECGQCFPSDWDLATHVRAESKYGRSSDRSPVCLRPKQESDNQVASSMSSSSNTPQGFRRFATCYICGREFGSKSITIHERQCLKKWQLENDKLPKRHRRQEPQKPELAFNDDGTLNLEAVADAAWKSHLEQLVACPKCKRTFNPDRLIIHEKVCSARQA